MYQFNEYAKDFFKKKKKRLLEVYPGMTLRRLQEEVRHYTLGDMFNDEELYIPSQSNPITHFFQQVESGIPLPYISGRSFFYKSEFIVNANVLIPRFETEVLVELTLFELNKVDADIIKVTDIGTGSGAIILSLMQDYKGQIDGLATDISKDALEIAKKNYFHLRFTIPKHSKLRFLESDRLSANIEKQHIIVSNPPYIKASADRTGVSNQVDVYEPHLALYLEDECYESWFETLFKQAFSNLHVGGVFLMEGHEHHLENLKKIAISCGFSDVKITKDYTDRNRFLIARKING